MALNRSGCHPAAALSTAAALLDTLIHVADLLARAGTLLADLCAFAAGMLVVLSADQHEMGRGFTDLSARHHDPEMARLDVLAADLEAVVHRLAKASLIAAQALINAGLHVG
jgi:hypothetical protein